MTILISSPSPARSVNSRYWSGYCSNSLDLGIVHPSLDKLEIERVLHLADAQQADPIDVHMKHASRHIDQDLDHAWTSDVEKCFRYHCLCDLNGFVQHVQTCRHHSTPITLSRNWAISCFDLNGPILR